MDTAPQIPRAQWAAHPRFPAQTLLLGSHENFRILALRVLERASDDPIAAQRLFRRWMAAMGSHEAYEERKLYPFLSDRWGVSMAPLEDGHRRLGRCKADVLDAFLGVLDREGGDDERARLLRALVVFGETLREHLDLEEETVIPLLLELRAEEFARYYYS